MSGVCTESNPRHLCSRFPGGGRSEDCQKVLTSVTMIREWVGVVQSGTGNFLGRQGENSQGMFE